MLNFFGISIPDEEPALIARIQPILARLRGNEGFPQDLMSVLELDPDNPQIVQFIIGTLLGGQIIGGTVNAAMTGPYAEIAAHSMKIQTPTRPPLIDAIQMFHGGLVSDEETGDIRVSRRLIVEDAEGNILAKGGPHSHVVHPGDDYSNEDPATQAICAVCHTPEVVQAWAYKQAQLNA